MGERKIGDDRHEEEQLMKKEDEQKQNPSLKDYQGKVPRNTASASRWSLWDLPTFRSASVRRPPLLCEKQ